MAETTRRRRRLARNTPTLSLPSLIRGKTGILKETLHSRIELAVRPEERFPVPQSDGYPVYGALLSVLDGVDGAVSQHVHDSPLGAYIRADCRGYSGVVTVQTTRRYVPGRSTD